jgi:2-polyprenyl-3-methyl-5-hydroxy-6-metoxy-1,4-benzoquinol methylase
MFSEITMVNGKTSAHLSLLYYEKIKNYIQLLSNLLLFINVKKGTHEWLRLSKEESVAAIISANNTQYQEGYEFKLQYVQDENKNYCNFLTIICTMMHHAKTTKHQISEIPRRFKFR